VQPSTSAFFIITESVEGVVFIVCGLDLFSYRVQQKQFMIMLPVKDSYGRRAMSASHNVYFKEVFLKAI